jgi:hypothetical protein
VSRLGRHVIAQKQVAVKPTCAIEKTLRPLHQGKRASIEQLDDYSLRAQARCGCGDSHAGALFQSSLSDLDA